MTLKFSITSWQYDNRVASRVLKLNPLDLVEIRKTGFLVFKPAGVGHLEDYGDGGGGGPWEDDGLYGLMSEDGVGRLQDEATGSHYRGALVVDDGEVMKVNGVLWQPHH